MLVSVESAIASMKPKPNSGVDWRSAEQFPPLRKAPLVGSQIGSVVANVVRVASSVWHFDRLHLGEVIWQPRGVDSTPVGKMVWLPCLCGPRRRMLSLAKMCTGPPALLLRTRTSLMNEPEPPSAGWKWQLPQERLLKIGPTSGSVSTSTKSN